MENFRWLHDVFGETIDFNHRQLVVPSGTFTTGGKTGHAMASHVLEQVKRHAGLDDWPTSIAAHDEVPHDTGTGSNIIRPVVERHAAGTFSADADTGVLITYSQGLLADPHGMVATFAHELAHFLLATSPEPLPVPDEEVEFLTDLTAVFLGFGLFLCNTRFRYEQFSDGVSAGWSMKRQGYLPEHDLVFATALFMSARDIGYATAEPWLKPSLLKSLKRGLAQAKGFSLRVSHS